MHKFYDIINAYQRLLKFLFKEIPVLLLMTFLSSILCGLTMPLLLIVNAHIFNDGLAVAQGKMTFSQYSCYIILFFILSLAPVILNNIFINGYVDAKVKLILRTKLKARLLDKVGKLKYEHFEKEDSIKVIDRVFNNMEQSLGHMFPFYVVRTISAIIASIGSCWFLGNIKWWLLGTVLLPFILETVWCTKHNDDIYERLDEYWSKEKSYQTLGDLLKTGEVVRENKLYQSTEFLTNTYKERLHKRNKEYEEFYIEHLKSHFGMENLTKITPVLNIVLLLFLFINREMDVGTFISASSLVFGELYSRLAGCAAIFYSSGYHMKYFEYYDKFFALSEETCGESDCDLQDVDIEFRNVWFRYPGSDHDILKGVSFHIHSGEKISIVGINGEGKSTIIKLLLGLFKEDAGEILLNGKPLACYSAKTRSSLFGVVFQDFVRYSVTARENIEIGDIGNKSDEVYDKVIQFTRAKEVINTLPIGEKTLLGKNFEDGTEISGGEWQRIALARAYIKNSPIMIFDEPTSQLDPITESNFYREFMGMTGEKTVVFITHRLASTQITDRILVLSDGQIVEQGSHKYLMEKQGIYYEMYENQKKWYRRDREHEA